MEVALHSLHSELQESAKIRVNEYEYAKNWKIVFAVLCIFFF